jgi:hypothetical protein
MAAPRPGDRHKYRPISFRPTEDDREWLEKHAAETASPVRAILADALAAYRAAIERAALRSRLLADLAAAKSDLDMPLEIDGETWSEREARVYTGTDGDPGVYWDSTAGTRSP